MFISHSWACVLRVVSGEYCMPVCLWLAQKGEWTCCVQSVQAFGSLDFCSLAQRRFFKAGGMGSYDPQIIKPPEVLLGWIREALKNIDGKVGGWRRYRFGGWVGIAESHPSNK